MGQKYEWNTWNHKTTGRKHESIRLECGYEENFSNYDWNPDVIKDW